MKRLKILILGLFILIIGQNVFGQAVQSPDEAAARAQQQSQQQAEAQLAKRIDDMRKGANLPPLRRTKASES